MELDVLGGVKRGSGTEVVPGIVGERGTCRWIRMRWEDIYN